MAYSSKKSGIIEVRSLNFPTRAQWHINAVLDQPEHDWADYLHAGKKAHTYKRRMRRGHD